MRGTEVVGACDTADSAVSWATSWAGRDYSATARGNGCHERCAHASVSRSLPSTMSVSSRSSGRACSAALLAWLCQSIGTPVVPRTGRHVRRDRQSRPGGGGRRLESRVPLAGQHLLPGALHQSDRRRRRAGGEAPGAAVHAAGCVRARRRTALREPRYYFELGTARLFGTDLPIRIPLPAWLSPGTTHVEHQDESAGWFRFTMTVRHPTLRRALLSDRPLPRGRRLICCRCSH